VEDRYYCKETSTSKENNDIKDLKIQQLEIKYFEICARQHGTCVMFSQRSANSKNA